MKTIPVVENPRRSQRRRRSLSASQKRAGFGGRAAMRRRSSPRRRGRRRNPALATLINPRRRRRSSPPMRYGTYRRHYSYPRRRRRNPSLSGLTRMLNLPLAVSVAGGVLVARSGPGLLQRVWAGAPVTGIGGMAIRVGGVLAAAMVAKTVFRSNTVAVGLVAGGVGYMLYELAETHLLPRIGLSGYYSDYRYGLRPDLSRAAHGGNGGYANGVVPTGNTVDSVLAA